LLWGRGRDIGLLHAVLIANLATGSRSKAAAGSVVETQIEAHA
jgi:hypothetical protein